METQIKVYIELLQDLVYITMEASMHYLKDIHTLITSRPMGASLHPLQVGI